MDSLLYYLYLFLFCLFLNILASFVAINHSRIKPLYYVEAGLIYTLIHIADFSVLILHFGLSVPRVVVLSSPIIFFTFFFRKFRVAAITGGDTSGKTALSKFMKEGFKFPVIDVFGLLVEILREKGKTYQRIKKYFGDEVLNKEGEVNEAKLKEKLSSSVEFRRVFMEAMGLSLFFAVLKKASFEIFQKKNAIVVLDCPFLLNLAWLRFFVCPIIGVYVKDSEEWEKRIMKKYSCNREEAQKKVRMEMSIMELKAKSDLVVDTSKGQTEANEELFEKLVGYI